ncbi:hypothetical protein [Francisella sp. LA112445]|jgi:hypothetical protein|uniref:hypothetical protein n=1 Tax=Francisella sp. LA112445 TaxID=1395624 RepID=UPI001788DBD3|nr:hypothetical protein [Francisella sp. LA112445]QIW09153.1 hypothetical protein FIP56_00040 [Francisella sp. LA112445]
MKCPFKESESCGKKFGLCALAMFLTILGVAIALKIITLILCIFPGSIHENTWLVVISIILVLFAAKCHKSCHCCDSKCSKSCDKEDSGKKCCTKNEESQN